jgi:surface polysaccharide O-acyltransferase-like enzyme
MMPLLFVVAGISSAYALKKRSASAFAKERVNKLLIPLIFGLLLLVPIQSFLAGLFHTGSANYLNFFTDFSDISGTGGGFTTGQLWFILYLFIISIVSLPFLALYNKRSKQTFAAKIPLAVLIAFAVIPVLAHPILDIGGKSIGENLCYFLLGYFVLANENVLQKLDKYRFLLLGIAIVALIACYASNLFYGDYVYFEAVSWLSIIAIMGLARHYLDFSGKITGYLSKSSFGVYLFHQSWIVVAAYFIFQFTGNPALQIATIMLSAIVLTYLSYEISRRVPPLRWAFGLKK